MPPTRSHAVRPRGERRKVRPISLELLEHCTNYLEEQLYPQGIATLSSALLSGTSTGGPAFVPPAQHLSFITTLCVHPQFTTRTAQQDKQLASRGCLRYVKDVARVLARDDDILSTAFRFELSTNSTREQRARQRHSQVGGDESASSHDTRQIHSPFADAQSLYRNAEDFWHIVGWALNCSVRHPARWLVWEAWLRIMLDALEENFNRDGDADARADEELERTLIVQYLRAANGGRCNVRRVIRAIFADGSPQSTAQFPEVWRNETRPPTIKDDKPEKRRQLDIENDEYADYFDHGSEDGASDDESQPQSTSKPRPSRMKASDVVDRSEANSPRSSSTTASLGDSKSIHLRCRLMALLIRVSHRLPGQFTAHDELLILLAEFLRPLPVSIFARFVLPVTPFLPAEDELAFREVLFRPLIVSHAPANNEWTVTKDAFQKCYAPFAASTSTTGDAAKMSLLVEGLLRSLLQTGAVAGSQKSIRKAIEDGIAARRDKIRDRGGKRSMGEENDLASRSALECSETRMRALLANDLS